MHRQPRRATTSGFNAMRADFTSLRDEFGTLRDEFGTLRDETHRGLSRVEAGQRQIVTMLTPLIDERDRPPSDS